jgi:hypothetical protein
MQGGVGTDPAGVPYGVQMFERNAAQRALLYGESG